MTSSGQTIDECLRTCTECQRVAIETLNECLRIGGRYADLNHIRILLDMIEQCQRCADSCRAMATAAAA